MRVKLKSVFRGIGDFLLGIRPKLVPVRCLSGHKRGALDVSKIEICFSRGRGRAKSHFS